LHDYTDIAAKNAKLRRLAATKARHPKVMIAICQRRAPEKWITGLRCGGKLAKEST